MKEFETKIEESNQSGIGNVNKKEEGKTRRDRDEKVFLKKIRKQNIRLFCVRTVRTVCVELLNSDSER